MDPPAASSLADAPDREDDRMEGGLVRELVLDPGVKVAEVSGVD